MKKKSFNFVIPLVVYPFDVMLSLAEADEELFKKLKRTNVRDDELEKAQYDGEVGLGRYCLFDCGASLIRLRRFPKSSFDFGILAHEIFHAATAIMWRIGMSLEIKVSDEAYAYLIQYLTQEIYKKIF